MALTIAAREAHQVPFRSFTPFLLISFGLAWGILGLYIFLPERMEAMFGQLTGNHPLFFLAVYAPAIAAFALVASHGGFTGLRRFLGRALLWRCSAAWYAFFDHRPSVDLHWRFRAQREPFCGTVSLFLLSGCALVPDGTCAPNRSERGRTVHAGGSSRDGKDRSRPAPGHAPARNGRGSR